MKKLIYYVEDDTSINDLIGEVLTQNGFDWESFSEPMSFLNKMAKKSPDLIVLDLMLPQISGYDIIKFLKNKEQYKQIPIIVLSAKSLEGDIVKGLDLGASDYITKPFGLKEFISRINTNLRKVDQYEGMYYEAGELSLDTEKHEFKIAGVVVPLRIKEFEIMELLLENKGNVVTRTVLFKEVWGIDIAIETRTLDMHIKTIREKIAEKTDKKYIETIRGVGYTIK